MTLTLNEKEKKALISLVNDRIDEHLSRFPYFRYPVEPLEEWRRLFAEPKPVPTQTVKQALDWQFGGWQRKDLPHTQKMTVIHAVKAWPELSEAAAQEPKKTLAFWKERLPDWQSGFDVAALLLHLSRPDAFELADRHRLQAMTDLLKEVGHPAGERTINLSLQDLEDYALFFRAVLPKLPKEAAPHTRLDRFLKAYGNRHAYRNVAADYKTKEPGITTFSWNNAAAKQFDLSKIKLRSNADILFSCLLLSLDKHPVNLDELTIGQVTSRLPLGTAGICNPASYNYAMIALFGNQKGRDYFQLETAALRETFTEQANQSTRDMQFYARHASEKVILNPKYIRS